MGSSLVVRLYVVAWLTRRCTGLSSASGELLRQAGEGCLHVGDDKDGMAQMQRAPLSDGCRDLEATRGLIAPDDRRARTGSGNLSNRCSEGTLSGFWPGRQGDGSAEFECLQSDEGESCRLCRSRSGEARGTFCFGRAVRVEYMEQLPDCALAGTHESRVVIFICAVETWPVIQAAHRTYRLTQTLRRGVADATCREERRERIVRRIYHEQQTPIRIRRGIRQRH